MPDIFGRHQEDYQSVSAFVEGGQWEARQQAMAQIRPHALHQVHNFNTLGQGIPDMYQRAEPNAQAVGFMTDNLLAIQTMVDEILYLKYRLPDYIHLNMNIPDGADSYGVRIIDRTGRGEFITNTGTDAPVARVSQRLEQQQMYYAGINADYTVEDLRNAMTAGIPLDSAVIEAAVDGALEHMEAVGLSGSTVLPNSPRGLINWATGTGNDQVNLETQPTNETFSNLTGMDIRDVINDDISWVIETTQETLSTNITQGMSIYLPTQQFNRLVTRFVGDNQEVSVMRGIMMDNPWTFRTSSDVQFKSVPELADAGVSSTDRMVIACKDPRVFEMGVSIPPRVLKILDMGRNICAQIEYKFSPLFMKRATTVRYRDAI